MRYHVSDLFNVYSAESKTQVRNILRSRFLKFKNGKGDVIRESHSIEDIAKKYIQAEFRNSKLVENYIKLSTAGKGSNVNEAATSDNLRSAINLMLDGSGVLKSFDYRGLDSDYALGERSGKPNPEYVRKNIHKIVIESGKKFDPKIIESIVNDSVKNCKDNLSAFNDAKIRVNKILEDDSLTIGSSNTPTAQPNNPGIISPVSDISNPDPAAVIPQPPSPEEPSKEPEGETPTIDLTGILDDSEEIIDQVLAFIDDTDDVELALKLQTLIGVIDDFIQDEDYLGCAGILHAMVSIMESGNDDDDDDDDDGNDNGNGNDDDDNGNDNGNGNDGDDNGNDNYDESAMNPSNGGTVSKETPAMDVGGKNTGDADGTHLGMPANQGGDDSTHLGVPKEPTSDDTDVPPSPNNISEDDTPSWGPEADPENPDNANVPDDDDDDEEGWSSPEPTSEELADIVDPVEPDPAHDPNDDATGEIVGDPDPTSTPPAKPSEQANEPSDGGTVSDPTPPTPEDNTKSKRDSDNPDPPVSPSSEPSDPLPVSNTK